MMVMLGAFACDVDDLLFAPEATLVEDLRILGLRVTPTVAPPGRPLGIEAWIGDPQQRASEVWVFADEDPPMALKRYDEHRWTGTWSVPAGVEDPLSIYVIACAGTCPEVPSVDQLPTQDFVAAIRTLAVGEPGSGDVNPALELVGPRPQAAANETVVLTFQARPGRGGGMTAYGFATAGRITARAFVRAVEGAWPRATLSYTMPEPARSVDLWVVVEEDLGSGSALWHGIIDPEAPAGPAAPP